MEGNLPEKKLNQPTLVALILSAIESKHNSSPESQDQTGIESNGSLNQFQVKTVKERTRSLSSLKVKM